MREDQFRHERGETESLWVVEINSAGMWVVVKSGAKNVYRCHWLQPTTLINRRFFFSALHWSPRP